MMDDVDEGKFILIVEDIFFEDVGIYKCVVINEEGQVSFKVVLVVEEKMIMLEFIDEEESVFINVIDGDEFCLIIVVIGKLVFVVDWYKDDKKIRKIS